MSVGSKPVVLGGSVGFKRQDKDNKAGVIISVRPGVVETSATAEELNDLYVWLGNTLAWLRHMGQRKAGA
jgi:hypothetical protein